jgi:hypothetical protein
MNTASRTLTLAKDLYLFPVSGSGNDQTHTVKHPGEKVKVGWNQGLRMGHVYEKHWSGKMLGATIDEGTVLEKGTFKNWPSDWKFNDDPYTYKSNPESAAASFYETFHGTPSTEVVDVVESIHEHDNLTPLGGLRELVVHTLSGYKLAKTWGEDKTGDVHDIPFLCSSEDGNQLYIRGGDQTIDLDSIKMGPSTKWNKEKIVVGDIHLITYRTRKSFDKFKDIDYFHKLGEETRVRPTLVYDTRSQLMEIVGGQYHIDDPLIGVSRGIIN